MYLQYTFIFIIKKSGLVEPVEQQITLEWPNQGLL